MRKTRSRTYRTLQTWLKFLPGIRIPYSFYPLFPRGYQRPCQSVRRARNQRRSAGQQCSAWSRDDRSPARVLRKVGARPHLTVEQAIKKFPEQAGITRMGKPEEIADQMSYLVSPAAKWMTGAAVRMDGGEIKGI
jgi:hypothetical protein